jgi:HEAT repeat protein
MNDIERWLAEGSLNSDGRANEVVDLVMAQPDVLDDVLACLESANPVVRGHAADALEKIGRERPADFLLHITSLEKLALRDPVPMVKWHLAMLFGHLSIYPEHVPSLKETLLILLRDRHLFVQSWAITSLAIIARLYPDHYTEILNAIAPLAQSGSAARRKRAGKALVALTGPADFPKGWVKSRYVQDKLAD